MKSIALCSNDLSDVTCREVINIILKCYSEEIVHAVPHTSRRSKPSEVHGVHFHFVSEEAFKKMQARSLFLEHSKVGSHSYGTSLESVERIHSLDRICLITVNEIGFKCLKSKHFPAKYISLRHKEIESTIESKGAEEKQTETLEEQSPNDQFDLILSTPADETVPETLRSQLLEWFPELSSCDQKIIQVEESL